MRKLLLIVCVLLAGCGATSPAPKLKSGGDPKLIGTEEVLSSEVLVEAQQNAIDNGLWARFSPEKEGTLEKVEVRTGAAANTATKMLLGVAEGVPAGVGKEETYPKAILSECSVENGGAVLATSHIYSCNLSPTVKLTTGERYWLTATASTPSHGTLHLLKGALAETRLVGHLFPPCASTKLSECQEAGEVGGEGENSMGFSIKGMGTEGGGGGGGSGTKLVMLP